MKEHSKHSKASKVTSKGSVIENLDSPNVDSFLLRLWRNVRPWHVALAYLITMIVFACIFALISAGFHHEAAEVDKAFVEQSSQVAEEILDHFKETFRRKHGTYEYVSDEGWNVNVANARPIKITFSENNLHLSMKLVFFRKVNGTILMRQWTPRISWPIHGKTNLDLSDESTEYVGHASIDPISAIASPISMAVLFPGTTDSKSLNIIFIPNSETLRAMINLQQAASGPADRMTNKLVRMFYVSAVTITTLGYGDIVPTNDLARALVAAEAILGIFLAGGFLTAVSSRVTHRNNSAQNGARSLIAPHRPPAGNAKKKKQAEDENESK